MAITARRIVTIRQDLLIAPEFDVSVNTLNFVPDEVVVRLISLATGAFAAPIAFTIYSDLFNDNFISISATPSSAVNICPNTSWRPQGGNGTWHFTCLNGLPAARTFTNAIVIFMQLEFIKHG